ncbi:hypothetical protein [Nocardia sp. CC227C]|uniref:hypothetical protein n=1 Tax=Nocardia sp. CC227C TaxID=3044562 RepID=UPI00278C7F2E|nr:hypothetical protein [Nocardia sp. CC227C]
MSQNEVDQITKQTGATFRDVLNVAGAWLRTRRRNGSGARLSRKERRELAEQIQAQVSAERIESAWYHKRVGDYHREAAAVQYRRESDPFYTSSDAALDRERLAAMRYRIEASLPNTTALAVEQRGQVVLALDAVERDPKAVIGNVFPTLDADRAAHARQAAVESEQWVTARQQELEQAVTAAQAAAVHDRATGPKRQARPERSEPNARSTAAAEADADRAARQADAVQDIRHAQVLWQREQASGKPDYRVDVHRRMVADQAAAAGLSVEQIRWEFENAEANSRCRVRIDASAPGGRSHTGHGYFASEAEAAAWVHQRVTETDWQAGTQLAVRAREAGQRKPFYFTEGSVATVAPATHHWDRAAGDRGTDTRDSAATSRDAHSGGDTGTPSPEQVQAMMHGFRSASEIWAANRADYQGTTDPRAWQLADSILTACGDEKSALVQGKLRDLAERHGTNAPAAANEFTHWWVMDGGGVAYHSEKAAREHAAHTNGSSHGHGPGDVEHERPMNAFATATAAEHGHGHERDGAER